MALGSAQALPTPSVARVETRSHARGLLDGVMIGAVAGGALGFVRSPTGSRTDGVGGGAVFGAVLGGVGGLVRGSRIEIRLR